MKTPISMTPLAGGMTQTAAVQATMNEDELPEAIPTASGLTQPLLVADITEVPRQLQTAAKRAGMRLVRAHHVNLPGIELDVEDTKSFLELAKEAGAKTVYLWGEPLHPRADPQTHARALEDAISEMNDDMDDPEDQEAQSELREELTHAQQILTHHTTLLHGAGYLDGGVMHQIFLTEADLVDSLLILSSMLEATGGKNDDDDDDELHEMDPEEGAEKIIEHVEEELEVAPRDMRRRANELARQAAHQMVEMDELGAVEKQRVQQAIKLAAVRMRKGG